MKRTMLSAVIGGCLALIAGAFSVQAAPISAIQGGKAVQSGETQVQKAGWRHRHGYHGRHYYRRHYRPYYSHSRRYYRPHHRHYGHRHHGWRHHNHYYGRHSHRHHRRHYH